jgi:nucleoid DNA-binding protein
MHNATKLDLIIDVSRATGLTQGDTRIVVEEFFETVSKILESGKYLEIRGFGTFHSKIRLPRPARNPKTGEKVPLYMRLVPLFKYSKEFKKSIASSLMQKGVASKPGV